jgi:peptidoglycan pentaglycine glycine transferase (the first glycine)
MLTHNKPEPTYRASTFKREQSPAAWRQALGSLPNAHALQSWTWGEFKSRWGWQKIPLLLSLAENSRQPLAAAMVLKRQLPRLPFSILYVPKGPALDYKDGPLRRQVLAQLEKVARREKAILIKIDPDVVKAWGEEQERPSPIGSQFTKELKERGWLFSNEQIQFRNTVELYLEPSEEDLLLAMKQKTRYNIRYAGRKGITVRPGGPADFDTILQMYRETAERDNFTIRPPDYYRDAWTSLYQAGMAQPLLAEYEAEPVAAVILVKFGDKVIYMYGASTEKERRRMPNYLLQWEAIRWAKAQGCRTYDFWGAPDAFVENDPLWGVWRFKAGFAGEVVHHIGAWDYPVRPLLYKLYTQLLPRYLNWLRR